MAAKFDLSSIAADINVATDVAAKLAPFLGLIPGLAPYAPVISAAIPSIVKAAQAIEQALGMPVGLSQNTQAVESVIDPTQKAPAHVLSVING